MRARERVGIVVAVIIAILAAVVFASYAPARFPGPMHQESLASIANWRH